MSEQLFIPAGVRARYNVKVPVRDGTKLSAYIFLPDSDEGPFPTILARTCYDNSDIGHVSLGEDPAIFYPQHGYVYVLQDVRGRGDSDGEFYPWLPEAEDGYDTIEWIADQPWCDGNVGMSGLSFLGSVQWEAAVTGSRHLKAIAPRVIGDNLHNGLFFQGGPFALSLSATWSLRVDGRTMQNTELYNREQLFSILPLKDMPAIAGKDVGFYQDWLKHPDYDDYWKAVATDERYEDIDVPALQVGGWYDMFPAGVLGNFAGLRERGGSDLARRHQKAIVGPWVHTASTMTHAGEVDFGKDSMIDLMETELRWFDRWLKGVENGVDEEPPLRIFVMGSNEWRDEMEWPLARTVYTPYYLHSGGSANSLVGDGRLSTEPPADEPPDRYTYNPAFPVPTRGGGNCCDPDLVPWGAYDQRQIEYRNDVLVYTSEPLEDDLEVTGPIVLKLFAGTHGPDTDFTGKLVDVFPDGYAMNLCDGIIRGRYRESLEYQKLLEPGTVYEFSIELWPTSNVFLKGHRIRVDVTSSNFPRFDRNPNTGHKFAQDAEMRVALQTIAHDAAQPSHILLPVIPGT